MVVAWLAISLAASFGIARPFFDLHDGFADFFKFVQALPGPPLAPDPPWIALTRKYSESVIYHTQVSVYHVPPLTMLITQGLRAGFSIGSPFVIGLGLAIAFVMVLLVMIERQTGSWIWAAVVALSYPVVFLLSRGNLFAALSGTCALTALIRMRPDWLAAVLFAIAVNVRPNLALCVAPLVICDWRFAYRVALAGSTILSISAMTANAIDPAYTGPAFLHALRLYQQVMVEEGGGVLFGSSLWGAAYALKMPWPASLVSAVGLLIIPLGFYQRYRGFISFGDFTFVCAAASALSTPAFADYHLLIFAAPVLIADSTFAVRLASFVLLLPKGYGLIEVNVSDVLKSATTQVIINPAIMVAACATVLGPALSVLLLKPSPRGRKRVSG